MSWNLGGKYEKGFTLMELLVVIGVISVLASIVVLSLGTARAKARDTRRLANLNELRTALEIFYDEYGVYPCGDAGTSYGGTGDTSLSFPFMDGGSALECIGEPKTGLFTAGLIDNQHIKDPINDDFAYGYGYEVTSDRQNYVLYTTLETNETRMINDGGSCTNVYEVGN